MPTRHDPAAEVLHEIRSLGISVNRLTRHLDRTGDYVAEDAVKAIEDRLTALVEELGRVTGRHLSGSTGPATTVTLTWAAAPTNERIITMTDVSIPDDSTTGDTCRITFTDDKGNPTTGGTTVPTWTVSDGEATITLTVAEDGLSATAVPVGTLGESTVTITGLTNAAGTALPDLTSTVTVVAGEADAAVASWSPVTAAAPSGEAATAGPADGTGVSASAPVAADAGTVDTSSGAAPADPATGTAGTDTTTTTEAPASA